MILTVDYSIFSYTLKLEKQKNELAKELEDLQEALEEQGGLAATQGDLSRKREMELSHIRAEMQKESEEHEKATSDMRKKFTSMVSDLEGQLESMKKAKTKADKDNHKLAKDNSDVSSQLESITKAKVTVLATHTH